MTMWQIQNVNGKRWGHETYPSREAAQTELREFWKGISGVKLSKFEIVEIADPDDAEIAGDHNGNAG